MSVACQPITCTMRDIDKPSEQFCPDAHPDGPR